MNEKEALLAWNECIELCSTAKGSEKVIKTAVDKLEHLVTSHSLVGTSKLCYNVGLLSKQLGDLNKSMMVSM